MVKKEKTKINAPTIVKLISVFHYLKAGLYLIIGILLIFLSGFVVKQITGLGETNLGLNEIGDILQFDASVLKISVIILGIIFIGMSILNFFVARDLWKLKNWARFVTIALAALGGLVQMYNMISGAALTQIINLSINIFIIGYLGFFQEAKDAFNNPK